MTKKNLHCIIFIRIWEEIKLKNIVFEIFIPGKKVQVEYHLNVGLLVEDEEEKTNYVMGEEDTVTLFVVIRKIINPRKQ